MNQGEAFEDLQVRKLMALMDRAERPMDPVRSQQLFDQLMAKMAIQDHQRRRTRLLAGMLGVALLGAGVLQLLGG
jgi:hypothetical protein